MLRDNWQQGRMVCVGLDPDWEQIPESVKSLKGRRRTYYDALIAFNREIIEHTYGIAGTYKPQSSKYERFGSEGIEALRWTRHYLKETAPDVPVILDAKRGDIDRTNQDYVAGIYDLFGFDAVTLHHYLGGMHSLQPFLERAEKGAIILCRTSNKDAGEFQDRRLLLSEEELDDLLNGPSGSCIDIEALKKAFQVGPTSFFAMKLFEFVALRVANHWNSNNNCYLVVGATYPKEAEIIRRLVGDRIDFLVPGIGAQGGGVELAVRACRNSLGEGLIVNSSSGIIHASTGSNFATVARLKALILNEQINEYRAA